MRFCLSPAEREKIPPIAPDFVIELRSASDRLSALLQAKLREYRDNRGRFGWLLNPQDQRVEIDRPGGGGGNATVACPTGG